MQSKGLNGRHKQKKKKNTYLGLGLYRCRTFQQFSRIYRIPCRDARCKSTSLSMRLSNEIQKEMVNQKSKIEIKIHWKKNAFFFF